MVKYVLTACCWPSILIGHSWFLIKECSWLFNMRWSCHGCDQSVIVACSRRDASRLFRLLNASWFLVLVHKSM